MFGKSKFNFPKEEYLSHIHKIYILELMGLFKVLCHFSHGICQCCHSDNTLECMSVCQAIKDFPISIKSKFQIFSQNKHAAKYFNNLQRKKNHLSSLVSKFWQTMFCNIHTLVCAALALWPRWNLTYFIITLNSQTKAKSELLDIWWNTDQTTAQALKKNRH